MMDFQSLIYILTAIIIFTPFPAWAGGSVSLGGDHLESIVISKSALYPESIEYNPQTDKFLVGSFREGAVYEVDMDGEARRIVHDEHLISALGTRIDRAHNRLFVVTADLEASVRQSLGGSKSLAGVGIFDLTSGELLHFINLGVLYPDNEHLANDVAIDPAGNAYVTDSFSPVIYKIDPQGHPSIFLESEAFIGKGINLNGIVYHPDGYLLVAKKSEGILFKIPLSAPEHFTKVELSDTLIGADGLTLAGQKELVVVANRASG